MADDRRHSAEETEQILARAASLDAEGEGSNLSADDIRASALAAGIAPHAVERALREARSPAPMATNETGQFMKLSAIQRANITVRDAPQLTSKEIAARLRMLVGPDATISEELGTVRARYRDLVVTVMPGASAAISVVSDQAAIVATTSITLGAMGSVVGMIGGSMSGAALGLTSYFVVLALGVPVGIGAGLYLWRWHWRRELAKRAREIEALANSVAASLQNL